MAEPSTWEQILDYTNRANPYPFYDELRKTPVRRLPDGSYLVSTYAEIAALLHDPRVSSDITRNPAAAAAGATIGEDGDGAGMTPTFLSMDPPDHDKFRRITMRHFGPPTTPGRVAGMEARMAEIVTDLVDTHRQAPGTDLLSAMATDDGPEGRMPDEQLVSTGLLLLIAGHETTVNLISNGVLTLLRHPAELHRLRADPGLAIPMVEELLRYEPPVHFVPFRTALDDIDIAGTTIPAGASLTLVLAAGNRDPAHVADPGLFIPDRANNQHLGFGGGVHLCFGAPLARLEAQIALTEFATRLENPRLVSDPPPYRPSPFLRGPSHLPVDIDGVLAPGKP